MSLGTKFVKLETQKEAVKKYNIYQWSFRESLSYLLLVPDPDFGKLFQIF